MIGRAEGHRSTRGLAARLAHALGLGRAERTRSSGVATTEADRRAIWDFDGLPREFPVQPPVASGEVDRE